MLIIKITLISFQQLHFFRIQTYQYKQLIKNMSQKPSMNFLKKDPKPCIPMPPRQVNASTIDENLSSPLKKPRSETQQELGIKKWKIGKLLGGGTGGNVYKALNIKTGVLAAVKKIIYSSQDLQESRNELKILSKIRHSNVVNYIEDYQLENQTWVFMELIPSTLQKFYKSFDPPPYENFKLFARQMIQALAYLHKQKIVHKDLKCSNILLDSKCTIKLSDFGCSKGFQKTMSLMSYEKAGLRTFKGSVAWMAPEVINENKYTRKTDIWSLGCTLLQLATGKIPWHQKNFEQQIQAMYYIGGKGQIPQIPASLNQKVIELIIKCLSIDPDLRPSAQQLLKLPIFNQA